MKLTIDRFEGGYAVVEMCDKQMIDLPIKILPRGAQEGDIITINIDRRATNRRKRYIDELTKDLWE